MKIISIEYYAKLREETGLKVEKIDTLADTVSELFDELHKKYNFSLSKNVLKAAVNDEFCEWQTKINNNDNIVFIQPVAGG